MLNSHDWLVATILDRATLNTPKSLQVSQLFAKGVQFLVPFTLMVNK